MVSKERFAQGLTYTEYVNQVQVNKERFQQSYDAFTLREEDAQFFREAVKRPGGPARVLALAEDWCPDVIRGLPVMAKIAETAGIEMRVFARDKNLDIMNEFLNQGKFQSIPTFVFYTRELGHIAHWIERPKLATREMEETRESVEARLSGRPEEERRAEMRRQTRARWPIWQQETVRELRELLQQKE